MIKSATEATAFESFKIAMLEQTRNMQETIAFLMKSVSELNADRSRMQAEIAVLNERVTSAEDRANKALTKSMAGQLVMEILEERLNEIEGNDGQLTVSWL